MATNKPKLNVTFGADPEMFVYKLNHNTGEHVPVPVCGWLGGTKGTPEPLSTKLPKYKVQEDGICAEYNIPHCKDARSFAQAIAMAKQLLSDRIRGIRSDCYIRTSPYVMMNRSELGRYPQAYMFGCSPEFDAYSEGAVVPPISPDQLILPETASWDDPKEYRFAGGHIHIGVSRNGKYELPMPRYVLAALCDAYVGLWSLARDKQGARRKMYGQAGRFRPTKYGIEYRVLSNFWTNSEELTERTINALAPMLTFVTTNDIRLVMQLFDSIPWGAVREAINNEDEVTAHDLSEFVYNELYREAA